MNEPKISLYTRILRFFLRDLYNQIEDLKKTDENIRNIVFVADENAENALKNDEILKSEYTDKIARLESKVNSNDEKAENSIKDLNIYRDKLETRLRSDDVTTIELSHRIEVLEQTLKNNGLIPSGFELFNKKTYSQSGEDSIIMYIMAMLGIPLSECNYLDLGANQPRSMSNTFFFYEQGARGVLVEANYSLIQNLKSERPNDIILNKCITDKSGEKVEFNVLNLDGLSKIGDVSDILVKNPDARIEKTIELETITVNDIIEKYFNKKAPVILNLDIEGLEKQILESINFDLYRPLIMIIEMIPYSRELVLGKKDFELLEYVKSKGYEEYAFTGINSIFIDKNQYNKILENKKH